MLSSDHPVAAHVPPFCRVLEEHGAAVLRFCRAQAGRHAGDDAFQETMIAALRAYDEVRDVAAIKSWLFSIAARKVIDGHRASVRRPVPVADPRPAGTVDPHRGGEIWAEVAQLPEKQRHAVALRFLADLSHQEIGEVMRISEAAARRNVFEGLKRLRAAQGRVALPDRNSSHEQSGLPSDSSVTRTDLTARPTQNVSPA
jgi:DNA-directed RNA polymerase specialized sigma24 family protein